MSRNLKNRRNYNTINTKEDKTTQTVNYLEDSITKIIDKCVGYCCPMPLVKTNDPNHSRNISDNKIITKQPEITKKQKILREIDENFSDDIIDNEDWIQVNNNLLV